MLCSVTNYSLLLIHLNLFDSISAPGLTLGFIILCAGRDRHVSDTYTGTLCTNVTLLLLVGKETFEIVKTLEDHLRSL